MSYSPNFLKGLDTGTIQGTIVGVIKEDTRSLDYSSYNPTVVVSIFFSIIPRPLYSCDPRRTFA